MAISARLSRVLHHQLGDDAGEDLINWMGQVESNRSELRDVMDGYIALTNSRFAEYDARLDARFAASEAKTGERFASLEARFGSLETRFGSLETRFGTFETRMDGFSSLEARVDARFAALKGELIAAIQTARADMIAWSFVFWCATIAAIFMSRLIG